MSGSKALARFGDGPGKGGSGVSLIVDTRLGVLGRGSEVKCSTIVDILRDFPEIRDEELARVEDLEGCRAGSDSGVPSCASLLAVPERLRRDRAFFIERRDVGYRSTIAEPVFKNKVHLSQTDASDSR